MENSWRKSKKSRNINNNSNTYTGNNNNCTTYFYTDPQCWPHINPNFPVPYHYSGGSGILPAPAQFQIYGCTYYSNEHLAINLKRSICDSQGSVGTLVQHPSKQQFQSFLPKKETGSPDASVSDFDWMKVISNRVFQVSENTETTLFSVSNRVIKIFTGLIVFCDICKAIKKIKNNMNLADLSKDELVVLRTYRNNLRKGIEVIKTFIEKEKDFLKKHYGFNRLRVSFKGEKERHNIGGYIDGFLKKIQKIINQLIRYDIWIQSIQCRKTDEKILSWNVSEFSLSSLFEVVDNDYIKLTSKKEIHFIAHSSEKKEQSKTPKL